MTAKIIWVCTLLIIYPLGCLMTFGSIYGYSARKAIPDFNRSNIKNMKGLVTEISENNHPGMKRYTLTIPYEINGEPRQGKIYTNKKYNNGDEILFAYDYMNPEKFERIRKGLECYSTDALMYPGFLLIIGILFLAGTAFIVFKKVF